MTATTVVPDAMRPGQELAALKHREARGPLAGPQPTRDAGQRSTGADRAADEVERLDDLGR